MSAEQLLDTAEAEFEDGAFSPFWDSIERSMRNLGAIDSSITLIADRSNLYRTVVKLYKGWPPPFPVDPSSVHRLETTAVTAGRLQRIVRKAQRNFQFATIYEQRRTNEILIAGFANLGEAIYGLGTRLEESIGFLGDKIDDLSSSMTMMEDELVDAVEGVSSTVREAGSRLAEVSSARLTEVSSAIKNADSKAQTAMVDQAARQEKAARMLDNIQRHRVPPPTVEY
jgi:hypothetical protein